MRISLSLEQRLLPLRRRLELEGNQIVPIESAEFIITDKSYNGRLPSMLSGTTFNSVVMGELGYDLSDFPADCFVSRWFDSREGFSRQTFLGFPTVGVGERNMGAQVRTGCCGTWVQSAWINTLFSRPELTAILSASHHSGFVSLWLSSEDGLLVEMETGIPSWGLYNVLEGLPGTLGGFLECPRESEFLQSWTTSIVLSRFPFPLQSHLKERYSIGGISTNVEKHFWLSDATQFKNAWWTSSTIVGVATSWSDTLWKSNALAVATCSNLTIQEVQYRMDSDERAEITWERVKRFL